MGTTKTDGTTIKLPYIDIKDLTLKEYNTLREQGVIIHHTTEVLILNLQGEIKQTVHEDVYTNLKFVNTHYQVEDFQDFLDVYNQFKLMKML